MSITTLFFIILESNYNVLASITDYDKYIHSITHWLNVSFLLDMSSSIVSTDVDTKSQSVISLMLQRCLQNYCHYFFYEPHFQFMHCVAPRIRYHPPRGHMIEGVAIRLSFFLQLLDEYGIAHESARLIRMKQKKSASCRSSTKQYFLKKGVLLPEGVRAISRGKNAECKGCICIAKENVPESFLKFFSKGNIYMHMGI